MSNQSKTKASATAEKIAQLEAELAALKAGKVEEKTVEEPKEKEEDTREIRPDEYINVMSLLPWHLNLSTRERGTGMTYKFESFGQIKRIIYSDLVSIFEIHPAFLEGGAFYIMSPRVVRHHGLDDLYKTLLTKDMIKKILEGENSESCVELFKKANKFQQDVIVSFMIDMLVENPDSLDLNIVDKISRLSNVKILERANDTRATFSPEKEEEEKKK